MRELSRRRFLAGAGLGATALFARGARAEALPHIPLSFAVATEDGAPVRDAAWIDAHLAAMEALYAPLGVHPENVGVRTIGPRFAHMESRADRDALVSELRHGVVNVFVVGSLRDVDEPSLMRRGVHWRNRATPSARYVILSAVAMPGVLAHEMGHYFGLGHSHVTDNFMSYDRTGGPVFMDAAQSTAIVAGAREAFRSGELSAHR